MAGSPYHATSNVRSNKRRLGGFRLIIVLSMLFLLMVVFIWSEDLMEPLHSTNIETRQYKNNNDGTIPIDEIDEELNLLSSPKSTARARLMERFKKQKASTIDYKKHTKPQRSSLRQKDSVKESYGALPAIATDDSIPMPVAGSVVHAADALLCRDSVLDYVINATDLKDECDGLTRAYTQTCDAHEEENIQSSDSRERHKNRRLEMETNPVIHWQQTLHQWSDYLESVITQGLLNSKEEPVSQINEHVYDLAHRKLKADEPEEIDETPAGDSPLPTAAKKEKKPLSNLALPVNSKHVTEKTLTETLMLQQDNKLMKAVVNQTNITVTEAQADAAVSSNAVAEAAHFVSNILNDPTSVEARTCCTSILSVFHENCSPNEEEISDRRLFVGVGVIALCGLIKSLIRHFRIRWLPEAAGCILVGGTYEWCLPNIRNSTISYSHKILSAFFFSYRRIHSNVLPAPRHEFRGQLVSSNHGATDCI